MRTIINYLECNFGSQKNQKIKRKHHVIISGTGRAGTTFIIELLTKLGCDTGFNKENYTSGIDHNCNAGLEWDIRNEVAPYIMKSPWFCEYADEIIKKPSVAIDYVFIPIRDMRSAAASRIRVMQEHLNKHPDSNQKANQVSGGLWGTENEENQQAVLHDKLHSLLLALADSQIPITMMSFPRLVKDAEYTYNKLKPLLNNSSFAKFKRAFEATSRPELIHDFK
jgi:hypothetical protein